jgi:V/A-type H+-transporting ATPase subunit C
MGDRHFLNARLRALRGRLLPRKALERLSLLPDLPSIAAALRGGPYGRALETADAARGDEVAGLEEALRRDFSETLSGLLAMAGEECGATVRRCLGFWETRTLRAILRGKAARRPAEEILAALVPTGLHDEAALEALARQPDVRAVADLLSTWREPCAVPLRRALANYRGPDDIRLLEAALDRHFIGSLPRRRVAEREDVDLFLSLAADRANLVTALVAVAGRNPSEAFRQAFIPGGSVYDEADYDALLSAASVPEALSLASRSVFAPVIRGLSSQAGGVPRIPVVERQLDRVLLRAMRARMRVDPLGDSPVAGYLLEKEREVSDLRTIFRARLAGLDDAALAGLLVLDG